MTYLNHLLEKVPETHYLHYRDTFIGEIQSLVDEYREKNGFDWELNIVINKGRRYDKIVKEETLRYRTSTSVYGFIDKTNGNILKAATWKAPAKHPRGNIYEDDRMQFMGPYGPYYMDSIKSHYGA